MLIKKKEVKILLIILSLLFNVTYVSHSNHFGAGVKVGWGIGAFGFSLSKNIKKLNGQISKEDGEISFADEFISGLFFQYLFGTETVTIKPKHLMSLEIYYSNRPISFLFERGDLYDDNRYYTKIKESLTFRSIESCFKYSLFLYDGEWIDFGVLVGMGVMYTFSTSLSEYGLDSTKEQEKLIKNAFSKFNFYPVAGFLFSFLDRLASIEITSSFFLLNQLNKSSSFKKEYNADRIFKYHTSMNFDLKINIWEVITG